MICVICLDALAHICVCLVLHEQLNLERPLHQTRGSEDLAAESNFSQATFLYQRAYECQGVPIKVGCAEECSLAFIAGDDRYGRVQ